MEDRVKRFARDYSEAAWNQKFSNIAYKSYLVGYDQCIEDTVDMDEWQKRLSDSYSDLKDKHLQLKIQYNLLKEEMRKLKLTPVDND